MGWEFIWAEFNIRSLPYHSLAALDEATELFLHLVFEANSNKAQDCDGREEHSVVLYDIYIFRT